MDREDNEHDERPRPRVVDKRISARTTDPQRDEPRPRPDEPPAAPPPAEPTRATGGTAWAEPSEPTEASASTEPERAEPTEAERAEADRLAAEIARAPSRDWVANAAVTLANVAAAKLHAGDVADARVAIDALRGLIDAAAPHLGEAEAPLRQTLAQLQIAFTDAFSNPPP